MFMCSVFYPAGRHMLTSGVKRSWKTSEVCFSFHFIQLYAQKTSQVLGQEKKT